ncbi:MAG: CDP-diacylglycerol--glycerol-3-phosphate 3-phosphatidyltransferase [Clostridia bacterium]|nr:CDP-diacylglycerol--glycerol-3-phosphate 3-phosphatidyltransferase [Clostridia bacterium]
MNIANTITLVRISMIPLFLAILLINIPYSNLVAAAVFVIAAGTDGLDGYLARARKEVTNLGKFLDPLADKLLITSAFIYLVELNLVDAWIAIVIVAREFAVTGLRTLAIDRGIVIPANNWGKIKTVLQIIAVVILLLVYDLQLDMRGLSLIRVILYTTVAVTVLSGINYFVKAKEVFVNSE